MTPAQRKKLYHYVALAGLILGIICKSLPPEYQGLCEAIARTCTGG